MAGQGLVSPQDVLELLVHDVVLQLDLPRVMQTLGLHQIVNQLLGISTHPLTHAGIHVSLAGRRARLAPPAGQAAGHVDRGVPAGPAG